MKCPNCDHLLHIAERQNVEIDYCPSCRGVWLDKGELDKIIQFSNQQISQLSEKKGDDRDEWPIKNHQHKAPGKYDYQHKKHYPDHNGRKKSFLGDLFDFD